ncbi:hypothetical protein OAT16_02050 [Prolixibacteraceae bacterium]|nr:hypothetical protein [Prolixibacteraceae bacterium]
MRKIAGDRCRFLLGKFANFYDILELEQKPCELGYASYAVSCFDHWLTRDEFESEMKRADDESCVINKNRIDFLKTFYPILLYDSFENELFESEDELFEFEGFNEYSCFLEDTINGNLMKTLICPERGVIIHTSGDYTEIFHFLGQTDIRIFKDKVKEYNLSSFSY